MGGTGGGIAYNREQFSKKYANAVGPFPNQ
ncbi:hypothetical protein ACNKHK_00180 [Shigella flexneri]